MALTEEQRTQKKAKREGAIPVNVRKGARVYSNPEWTPETHRGQIILDFSQWPIDIPINNEAIQEFMCRNAISQLFHNAPRDLINKEARNYLKEQGIDTYSAPFFETSDFGQVLYATLKAMYSKIFGSHYDNEQFYSQPFFTVGKDDSKKIRPAFAEHQKRGRLFLEHIEHDERIAELEVIVTSPEGFCPRIKKNSLDWPCHSEEPVGFGEPTISKARIIGRVFLPYIPASEDKEYHEEESAAILNALEHNTSITRELTGIRVHYREGLFVPDEYIFVQVAEPTLENMRAAARHVYGIRQFTKEKMFVLKDVGELVGRAFMMDSQGAARAEADKLLEQASAQLKTISEGYPRGICKYATDYKDVLEFARK